MKEPRRSYAAWPPGVHDAKRKASGSDYVLCTLDRAADSPGNLSDGRFDGNVGLYRKSVPLHRIALGPKLHRDDTSRKPRNNYGLPYFSAFPCLGLRQGCVTATGHSTTSCTNDPDLAAVVAASSDLPEPVRVGIVAMARTVSDGPTA